MKKGGHFGSYRRDFFLAGITQRPVLQAHGLYKCKNAKKKRKRTPGDGGPKIEVFFALCKESIHFLQFLGSCEDDRQDGEEIYCCLLFALRVSFCGN